MNCKLKNRIILIIIFIILINLKCHKAKNPILFEESPILYIEYPLEYPFNLVGKDVVITIVGKAYETDLIDIIFNGETIGSAVNKEKKSNWRFSVDGYRYNWGAEGEKTLIVRAWAKGKYKDYELKIINNDSDLQQKAIEYIKTKRYWNNYIGTSPNYGYDGTYWRMVNKRIFIYNQDLKSYANLIDEVIEHWRKWTGFTFEYTNEMRDNTIRIRAKDCTATMQIEELDPKIPVVRKCYIVIRENPECAMDGVPGFLVVAAHEIAHCIGFGHYNKGISITNVSTCCDLVLNPFEQRAAKIIYSYPPGTKF